eukprot:Plantae.Rhodophyta-Purpureofilum_apyrenoidigerum.ctg18258.p1 GENE.Plantae.Rhodophyta-Purpureofilum_apyrenoidigerum.ctg18258~~Plantae.Rhodophyta-Purpureofilum_apyrenoidigerum.ctg18258.p1  ORF type:complete len:582 (-),score=102.04 Plantae.Rhodophyta-Purpureofilum_apyrenoidigerum.ctg18258:500-2245(-)
MDSSVMTAQKLQATLPGLREVEEYWGIVVSFRCPFRRLGNSALSMSMNLVDVSAPVGSVTIIVSQLIYKVEHAMPVRALGDVVCFRNLKVSQNNRRRDKIYLDFATSSSSAFLFAGETAQEEPILSQQPLFQSLSPELVDNKRNYLRSLRSAGEDILGNFSKKQGLSQHGRSGTLVVFECIVTRITTNIPHMEIDVELLNYDGTMAEKSLSLFASSDAQKYMRSMVRPPDLPCRAIVRDVLVQNSEDGAMERYHLIACNPLWNGTTSTLEFRPKPMFRQQLPQVSPIEALRTETAPSFEMQRSKTSARAQVVSSMRAALDISGRLNQNARAINAGTSALRPAIAGANDAGTTEPVQTSQTDPQNAKYARIEEGVENKVSYSTVIDGVEQQLDQARPDELQDELVANAMLNFRDVSNENIKFSTFHDLVYREDIGSHVKVKSKIVAVTFPAEANMFCRPVCTSCCGPYYVEEGEKRPDLLQTSSMLCPWCGAKDFTFEFLVQVLLRDGEDGAVSAAVTGEVAQRLFGGEAASDLYEDDRRGWTVKRSCENLMKRDDFLSIVLYVCTDEDGVRHFSIADVSAS